MPEIFHGPRKGEGQPSTTLHFAPFRPYISRVEVVDAIVAATGISFKDIASVAIRHDAFVSYTMAFVRFYNLNLATRIRTHNDTFHYDGEVVHISFPWRT